MIYNYTNFYISSLSEGLLDKMLGPTEEEVIASGVDNFMKEMINSRNKEGVKKALELGADINIRGNIYLFTVCGSYNFDIELLKIVLDAGIELDSEVLLRLYEGGNLDAIKMIEEHYNIDFIKEMKKSRKNDYLTYGIMENNFDIVKDSIENNASVWGIYIYMAMRRRCNYEILFLLMFLCNDTEFDYDLYKMFNTYKIRYPEYFNDVLYKAIQSFEQKIILKNKMKK